MKVHANTYIFTEPDVLNPNNFSGWLATNRGQQPGQVLGHSLAPGETLDFTNIDPHAIWDTPIQVNPGLGTIVITTLQYV